MAFEDTVAKLLEGTEAIGDVTEFVNTLKAEHAKEIGVHETKIESLTGEVEGYKGEIVDLKLTNYDLIKSKPVDGGTGNGTVTETTGDQGITSLFKSKD